MFRSLFKRIADSLGIPVTCHSSLAEMHSFAALKDFDVAVLDYYLESFRGSEIAEYVDVFFRDLPVILISGGEIDGDSQRVWPSCIRGFVGKSSGPYAIIERALDAVASARGTPHAKASCDLS
jgi:CheY-like chemotaxis protein